MLYIEVKLTHFVGTAGRNDSAFKAQREASLEIYTIRLTGVVDDHEF